MQYPQRCAVAKCGRQPTQIEYYETNPDGTGAAGVAVCGGHSGHAAHKWRLAGIDPIPGTVRYTPPTTDMEANT